MSGGESRAMSDAGLLAHLSRQVEMLATKIDETRTAQEALARAQVAIDTRLARLTETSSEVHAMLVGGQGLIRLAALHDERLTTIRTDLSRHLDAHDRGDFQKARERFETWKFVAAALVGAGLDWFVRRVAT